MVRTTVFCFAIYRHLPEKEYQVVFTDKQWLNAPELLRSAAPLVNDYANWVHRHGAGYANSCIGDAP